MALMLVANRRGRRVVCWGEFAKLVALLAPAPGVVCLLVYYLFRHEWSGQIFLIGLGAGLAIAVIILIVTLFTPIHRLPFLSEHPPHA